MNRTTTLLIGFLLVGFAVAAYRANFRLAVSPPPEPWMRPKQIGIIMALLVATAVAGTFVGSRFNRPPVSVASAEPPSPLEATRLQFGDVWESDKFVWTVPVVNRSERTVRVKGITGSCSCMDIRPKQFEVAPGSEVSVTVSIDLTAKQRPEAQAAFTLTPYVATDDNGQKQLRSWQLTGTSRPLIELPGRVYTGRKSVLSQPLADYVIPFRTPVPVVGIRVETTSASYRTSVQTDAADPTKHEFHVAFAPDLPVGTLDGDVTLTAEAKTPGTVYPVKRVKLTGDLARDVECVPGNVLGGGQEVGQWFERSVSLASPTGKPFDVTAVTTDGPDTTVERANGEYRVRQRCTAEGPGQTRVVFAVRAADGEYPVAVEVRYFGTTNGGGPKS